MSMRVLRKRHRTRSTNRPTPALSLTLRASSPVRPGTRVLYPVGVSERRINRDAWATLVAELIASETRGKKAPFARRVGVDTRTVDRWLAGEVDVREQSVAEVARAFGRSPIDLLVQAGFYRADELPAVAEQISPDTDEAIQLVRDDDKLTPQMKKQIIDRLLDLEAQDRQRRRELAQFLIEQARGA